MSQLNFNQLYYFHVVASLGSIKAACEHLHVTQPTISGQLRLLEEDLEFSLFHRKHRRLELTERGKRLFAKTQKMFAVAQDIRHWLATDQSPERNEFRIGVIPSIPKSYINTFALNLWRDPTNSVTIVQGHLNDLYRQLSEDEIDLILSDAPYRRKGRRYQSVNLGSLPVVPVATKKFSKLKKDFPKSLNGQPYVAFSREGQLQDDIDYFFHLKGIHPNVIGQVDDVDLMQAVAKKGLAVAVLPQEAVKASLRSGQLIQLGDLKSIHSHGWVIFSSVGEKKVLIRKVLNDFLVRQSRS